MPGSHESGDRSQGPGVRSEKSGVMGGLLCIAQSFFKTAQKRTIPHNHQSLKCLFLPHLWKICTISSTRELLQIAKEPAADRRLNHRGALRENTLFSEGTWVTDVEGTWVTLFTGGFGGIVRLPVRRSIRCATFQMIL